MNLGLMSTRIFSMLSLSIIAGTSSADNCTDVLKLSVITNESVQSEKDFNKEAASFCKDYAKSQGSVRKAGGTIGYGGFTLGGTSAKSNAESIAEKLCKSNNIEQLRDSAYRTYVKSIAPQAYSSYNQCISAGDELRINLLGGNEKYASIRVAFNSQSDGDAAGIIVDSSEAVTCIWKNSPIDIDTQLPLQNGQSKTLKCKRTNSSEDGYITIVDEKSSKKNAYLTIPWSAYTNGIPVSLAKKYSDAIAEIENLSKSFKGSVISFNTDTCPTGWSEYTLAYGRFIRGIDKGVDKIDPNGLREKGSHQEDSIKSHQHKVQVAYGAGGQPGAWSMTHNNPTSKHEYEKMKSEGDAESRPKNVALLYCVKD